MNQFIPDEPEYKRQIRMIIEENLVHACYSALDCPEDRYRGCYGHKQKHIDIMTDTICEMFDQSQVRDVGKGEDKTI